MLRKRITPAFLLLAAGLLLTVPQVWSQDDTAAAPVAVELSVVDVKVTVRSPGSAAAETLSAVFPKAVLSGQKVAHDGSLEVSFSVKKGNEAAKPQQTMLMLKNEETGLAAYAVAKAKGSSYAAIVTVAAVEKQLGKLAGSYKVTLLAGDSSASKSVSYALGDVQLVAGPGTGPAPAEVVRTAAFQPLNNLKPEISHIFRLPEKRPPAVISLAFAGLVFVPLAAVFIYVTGFLKANIRGLTAAPPLALPFHVSIAAMLALYVVFWLKLNLAQTLPLVGAIGVVIAVTGYHTLSGLAAQRLKKD